MTAVYAASGSRRALPALIVSISPASVAGAGLADAPGEAVATTNDCSATVSGGAAPFVYAWQLVSGDAAMVNSPGAASTTFTRSVFMNVGDPVVNREAVYRLRVTDANMIEAFSGGVTVETSHETIS